MSGSNGSGSPIYEFVGSFSLRIFHATPLGRFLVEVPEMGTDGADFTGISLAAALANCCQGLVFHLDEEWKNIEQVRSARAAPYKPTG